MAPQTINKYINCIVNSNDCEILASTVKCVGADFPIAFLCDSLNFYGCISQAMSRPCQAKVNNFLYNNLHMLASIKNL